MIEKEEKEKREKKEAKEAKSERKLEQREQREYVCKAKRVSDGKWIVGFYYELECEGGKPMILSPADGTSNEILPETLCEFTSLRREEDGKMIWENDVLHYTSGNAIQCDGIVRFGKYHNPWNSSGLHVGFYVDWQDDFQRTVLRKDLPFWIDRIEYRGSMFDLEEYREETEKENKKEQ